MATGKATREALLSEAGFENVFRTQNWVRRSKLFCRWFCSWLASGVHIRCCLNPGEVSFLLFGFVWWLDCLLLKESPSAFCSVRWLLEVFLVVAEFAGFAQVAGFHLDDCIECFTASCWPPLPSLDSYPRKQPGWIMIFSQSRYWCLPLIYKPAPPELLQKLKSSNVVCM